jgi:hypothetical protein
VAGKRRFGTSRAGRRTSFLISYGLDPMFQLSITCLDPRPSTARTKSSPRNSRSCRTVCRRTSQRPVTRPVQHAPGTIYTVSEFSKARPASKSTWPSVSRAGRPSRFSLAAVSGRIGGVDHCWPKRLAACPRARLKRAGWPGTPEGLLADAALSALVASTSSSPQGRETLASVEPAKLP